MDTAQSVTVVTSPTLSQPTRKGRAPSWFEVIRKDGPPATTRFRAVQDQVLAAAMAAGAERLSRGKYEKTSLDSGFGCGWLCTRLAGSGGRLGATHVFLVTVWFAAIGFGFGSIFAKHRPGKALFVFYWAFTLGLVAMIFSGFVSVSNLPTQVAVAGTTGALLGLIVGWLK